MTQLHNWVTMLAVTKAMFGGGWLSVVLGDE
jgi:hypothetical protein